MSPLLSNLPRASLSTPGAQTARPLPSLALMAAASMLPLSPLFPQAPQPGSLLNRIAGMYFLKSVLMKVRRLGTGNVLWNNAPTKPEPGPVSPEGTSEGLLLSNHVSENHSDKVLLEHTGEDVTLRAHQLLTLFNLSYGNNCLQGQLLTGQGCGDRTKHCVPPAAPADKQRPPHNGVRLPRTVRGGDDTTKGPRWSFPALPPFLHVPPMRLPWSGHLYLRSRSRISVREHCPVPSRSWILHLWQILSPCCAT